MSNHKDLKNIIAIIFILFIINVAACSSFRVSPRDYDNIKIERLANQRVSIYQPEVYRKGDQLVVSGTLKGKLFKTRLYGHVDIAVIGTEGKVLARQSVKCYRKFMKRRSSKYGYLSTITLPSSIEDIIIRVAYHKPVFSNYFNCENNLAGHNLFYD